MSFLIIGALAALIIYMVNVHTTLRRIASANERIAVALESSTARPEGLPGGSQNP